MGLLEVELETNMRQRLDTLARKRGLPTDQMVRLAVEKLVQAEEAENKPKHSIMELEGLGAEIWKDENGDLIDAQEYVNELRREWDHRL